MLKQVIDLFELLDRPDANATAVKEYLLANGTCEVKTACISSEEGSTEFIRVDIPGNSGKIAGGNQPTLGIVGRLGGLGARPDITGFVSDGDGALAALGVAAKIAKMRLLGDTLPGDVIITTHICPDAPTRPHKPVRLMGSPVDHNEILALEACNTMDAILSIDTTKGNRVVNQKGFAISPTVKQGYILRTSDDVLDIMESVSGKLPFVLPLSQQDITPYENGLKHINSILQPATMTTAPVIGVALVTESAVAGCATGATHFIDVEAAARFSLEVAKAFTAGECKFHDSEEFELLKELYGDMSHHQSNPKAKQ